MVGRVCDKVLPMRSILCDTAITDLWCEGKLERSASYSLFRALVTAMERSYPDSVRRGTLPSTCHVEALDSLDSKRVTLRDGRVVLRDKRVLLQMPIPLYGAVPHAAPAWPQPKLHAIDDGPELAQTPLYCQVYHVC